MRNPFARHDNGDKEDKPEPSEPAEGALEASSATEPGEEKPDVEKAASASEAHTAETKMGPSAAAFTLRDLLVVTYAIAPERLRPHVPEELALDRLPGLDGEPVAFFQTVCAFHADARWSLLPEGTGRSFHQVTQRALVRREGRRGAFQFRTLVGSDEARAAQRAISRDAEFARFSVYIAGDPARETYSRYVLRSVSDTTQAQYDISLTPPDSEEPAPNTTVFPSLAEAAAFLVDRPNNYFRASAPRSGIGLLQWRYGTLPTPHAGTATTARVGLWTQPPMSFLTSDELLQPYSVLVLPSVTVTSAVPRYAKFK